MSDSASKSDRDIAVEYLSSISGMSEERAKKLVDELSDSSVDSQWQPLTDLPEEISKDFMLHLLYTAVDKAHDMILITDAPEQIGKEKIIYANKGAAEVTGYSREELIGQTPSILQGPDTEEEIIERLVEQLSKGERFEGETFNYRKDGSRYRVRWSIDPIKDEEENITHFISVQQDVTSEWEKKQKLEQMLEERESLLGEIHHRVKNNLGVIVGLLELQSAKSSSRETQDILEESINRIQSIATLHEKLYETNDFSNISLQNYINELVQHLVNTMSTNELEVTTHTDIADISLSVNQAVPLALILNEIVTNSFKHGFEDRDKGTLWVSLAHDSGHFKLAVSDDGVGLPDNLEIDQLDSLGLRLIDTLCRQLEGEYSFENREPGTTFTLEFEL